MSEQEGPTAEATGPAEPSEPAEPSAPAEPSEPAASSPTSEKPAAKPARRRVRTPRPVPAPKTADDAAVSAEPAGPAPAPEPVEATAEGTAEIPSEPAPEPALESVAMTAEIPSEIAPEPDVDALQSEIEELRSRNAELAVAVEKRSSVVVVTQHIARSTAVVLMILIGALCLTISPVAIWGRNLILNTDRYVQTLKPLAEDPGMQAAIIAAVDKQVDKYVDVPAQIDGLLPPAIVTLIGPPLQSAVTGLVNTVVTKFVESPAFITLWVTINRTAHEQLVNVLTGNHDKAVDVSSTGRVVLDLAPIVSTVKTQLVNAGIGVAKNIPAVGATIQIAEVKGLVKAQKAVRALNTLANWLPWVGLVLIIGGIATARKHRRALIVSMVSVAAGMVVIGIGLLIGRAYYLNGVPVTVLPRATAATAYDTLVRYLRDGIRIVLAVALIIALIGWLFGRSRPATAIRHWLQVVPKATVLKLSHGRTGAFVTAYSTALSIGAFCLGLLVLILWDNPGTAVFITLLVLVVLVVGVVQLQRYFSTRDQPGPDPNVAVGV